MTHSRPIPEMDFFPYLLRPQGAYRPLSVVGAGGEVNFSLEPPLVQIGQMEEP